MSTSTLLTIDRRDLEHACQCRMCCGVDEFLAEVERARLEREMDEVREELKQEIGALQKRDTTDMSLAAHQRVMQRFDRIDRLNARRDQLSESLYPKKKEAPKL